MLIIRMNKNILVINVLLDLCLLQSLISQLQRIILSREEFPRGSKAVSGLSQHTGRRDKPTSSTSQGIRPLVSLPELFISEPA
jgi:hypothetical protein